MESINVLALHGFLGVPADWKEIQQFVENPVNRSTNLPNLADKNLKTEKKINWISFDLNSFFTKNSVTDFTDLTTKLVADIRSQYKKIDLICGYSLGGRIGLHLLVNDPFFFSHLIMISAQTGFTGSKEDKVLRLQNDSMWAKKFRSENFPDVLKSWNEQKIFEGSVEPKRSEINYSSAVYTTALETLSQSRQADFIPWIVKHPEYVTWVYGERDTKYRALAVVLKEIGVDVIEIKNAGHRVIFDQPATLAVEIKKKATR